MAARPLSTSVTGRCQREGDVSMNLKGGDACGVTGEGKSNAKTLDTRSYSAMCTQFEQNSG